jgi:hypothetical protein
MDNISVGRQLVIDTGLASQEIVTVVATTATTFTTTFTKPHNANFTITNTNNVQALGSYGPVGNLLIRGGNGPDGVTVNLNGKAYTGNLTVLTGNGNDSVNVLGAAGSAVLGATNINTGAGNDTVNLSATAGNGVRFGGTVNLTDTLGVNRANFGNTGAASTFSGDVTILGYTNVNLGAAGSTQADHFGGSVTINTSFVPFNSSINFNSSATISGNLSISSGAGSDTVNFGSPAAATTFTVNGSTQLNLGDGSDTVTLGILPATALAFNGSFSLTEGSGADQVSFGGAVSVGGDLRFTFGDGNVSFVNTAAPLSVGGNYDLTGGNGQETITVGGLIAGDLNFNLGNGTDNVTVFALGGTSAAPGGVLDWHSGNGSDTVTFLDAAGLTWNVNVAFGSNDDTFNAFGVPGSTLVGKVDGGGRVTANTFNNVGFRIGSPFQPSNFP